MMLFSMIREEYICGSRRQEETQELDNGKKKAGQCKLEKSIGHLCETVVYRSPKLRTIKKYIWDLVAYRMYLRA